MNKEQFTKELINRLASILGPEYLIRSEAITKNNGVTLQAIIIRKKDQTICPTIYTEVFFSQYQEGRCIDDIANDIIHIYRKNDNMSDFDVVSALSNASSKIFYKLVNTEANKLLLDNAPHKEWNDLSLLYYIDLGTRENDDAQGQMTITITNQLSELLGLSVEELDILAHANTEREVKSTICGVSALMESFFGSEQSESDMLPKDDLFYVLSTDKKTNGAIAVLFPNVVADFAKQMGVDTVYIIPSSIHEQLLIPARGNMSVYELNQMLRSVNETEVDSLEVLSQNCYIFANNSISVA